MLKQVRINERVHIVLGFYADVKSVEMKKTISKQEAMDMILSSRKAYEEFMDIKENMSKLISKK